MTNNTNNHHSSDVDGLIGQAWTKHYHGKHEEAIQDFRQAVANKPDHIDANYGLALSLSSAGQKTEAAEVFRKTRTLVESNIDERLPIDEQQRYFMLVRMIDQQLAWLA